MLVCLAMMAVAMPLGLRVVRRIRGAAAATLPDPNTSGSQQAPDPPMRPGPRPQRDVPEVAVGNNTAEVTEHTKVLVVGGSQAGLVASYYLSHAQVPHLVLDGERRVGDAWRRRWDSLELFSAACYSALPGLRFPGDPEHFPGKDEVADYLEAYAHTYQLPVKLHTRVRFLQASDGGYRVDTDAGAYQAQQVIVATGAYQQPLIPQLAAKLSDDVVQLHSAQYRNPQQLASNQVLVVGSANSGVGIAEDLAASHRVHLSRGQRLPWLPRRLLGKSLHWWGDHLGLLTAPLEGSWRGRTQRGDLLIGTSLRQLARRHGVRLVGRTIDAEGRTVRFADGQVLEAEAIVWGTGYRSDYSWIRVPKAVDEGGTPIHRRGVTPAPGLYFLGMHNQYSRGSSLLGFVRHDASFIVERICQRLAATPGHP
jgi:putative flavoprotein involved in K+ transport